jgi:hypothetical protein
MAHFNLNEYQTVQERIDLFWKKFPAGRFKLDIVSQSDTQVIIRASVWTDKADKHPTTVDFAEERIGTSPVNKISHVENCATSALGRAISALGGEFSPKGKRPSREEMAKVERSKQPVAQLKDWLVMAQSMGDDLDGLRLLYSEAKTANAPKETLDRIAEIANGSSGAEHPDSKLDRNPGVPQ